MNIKEIIEAWTIAQNPTQAQADLARERIEVCNVCPEKREIFKPICSKCGCPIGKKVFTNKENPCPLKKWAEIDKGKFPKSKVKKTLM